MHVGAVVMLDGPAPSRDEFVEHLESRLHLVPRYRQKLSFPRFEAGRPFWIDDPRFNLDYHVRHTALPSPGRVEQLRELAGRVFSQRLDRSKPLWEIWLVQGLDDDRFALLSKTHHALVDGVSGVDIATVLFDLTSAGAPEPSADVAWDARARALAGRAAGRGLKEPDPHTRPDRGGRARCRPRPQPGVRLRPRGGRRGERDRVGRAEPGAGGAPERAYRAAPARVLGRERAGQSQGRQERPRRDRHDVFLAAVAGALQRWLQTRGVRTEGMELRGLVPVSIRAKDQQNQLGNQIAALRGPCRSMPRTRSSGSRSSATPCRGSRSPSRRSAPR